MNFTDVIIFLAGFALCSIIGPIAQWARERRKKLEKAKAERIALSIRITGLDIRDAVLLINAERTEARVELRSAPCYIPTMYLTKAEWSDLERNVYSKPELRRVARVAVNMLRATKDL